jgi:hypothetical protein
VGYATLAERLAANPVTPNDPNILPGTADVSAPDGPDGEEGAGYLWDAAIRSGLRVRNYGFFIDLTRYSLPFPGPGIDPTLTDPFSSNTPVSFPTKAALRPLTDQFFRGYDNKFPDYYRVKEWEREFDAFEANGQLPNLEFVRVMHDHTGNFAQQTIYNLSDPIIQTADNDYAVGLIVEKVSHSAKYSGNTLIFVVEDDAQDGPDHVDAHRSIAFVAGAYVKRAALVSKPYTTVNLVRTIVDVLGIDHFNINEASAEPMSDVFRTRASSWSFNAIVPGILRASNLPLPAAAKRTEPTAEGVLARRPQHDGAYWAARTEGFDFSVEDRVDAARYNLILWKGLMGDDVPYPTVRSGADLRKNRKKMLKSYFESTRPRATVGESAPVD